MAQNTLKTINIRELNQQKPFACRYQFDDPMLKKSIAERGVIQPIMVAEAWGSMTIVAGHKRVLAAADLGVEKIDALMVEGDRDSRDLFMLGVLSNWQQQLTDLDIAYTLSQAIEQYNLPEAEVIDQVMPALGVKPSKALLQECCHLFSLEPLVIEAISKELIPFRGASALTRFDRNDQQIFVQEVCSKAQLTTNQILHFSEWVKDILLQKDIPLKDLLSEELIHTTLNQGQPDRRRKAEQLLKVIRNLRFPELSEREHQFQQKQQDLSRQIDNVAFEVPDYFEDEGFHLRIHARNQASLQETLSHLQEKKKLLNSLFDIML